MAETRIVDDTQPFWQTLRTFNNVQDEPNMPNANIFAAMGQKPYSIPEQVEFRFNPLTTNGSPTTITFTFWRFLGNKIDRLATVTYGTGDYFAPKPQLVRFDGEIMYVTVQLGGGTTPNVSTVCEYRIIK